MFIQSWDDSDNFKMPPKAPKSKYFFCTLPLFKCFSFIRRT